MSAVQLHRFKTIAQYHHMVGLPKPEHPLISVVNVADIKGSFMPGQVSLIFDFYSIAMKRAPDRKFKYGQQTYDFFEGTLFCMAPGQVFGFEVKEGIEHKPSGWMILIHPDFLWNTPLAKTIKQYEYFSYSANESLQLSEKEENLMTGIVQYMEQEYHSNIDKFTDTVITAQLELLLTYTNRFYQRQFITRKIANHQIIDTVEAMLTAYFNSDVLAKQGLPTVAYIAGQLNLTPGYLSELLKTLTGQSTQQHIHDKLIEKAKEKLSTTTLSISQIAYQLGFEHSQSFSKLFKTKTEVSPLEFRQSFN
ncbi:helix-turn-helix protein [Mucilaginibacter gracilis]|uniref:Helix-turn-helix protein n=1 Tax=Mucilaginibacter gracilis TaxID=423350 RepID=A0A495J840_9SPHI|nr:helix-turn-helix transcriptional regulator [Mucilaginibacter gracilis]RKR84923.1 helix-turn-helix protein [Mucilaginibacter gracilis]